jgi:cobalamin biosynthesis protein CbiG
VVIGLGFTSAATPAEVSAALAAALKAARCAWSDVVAVATLESRRGHPALRCLDAPSVLSARGQRAVAVRFYSVAALAGVRTPNPSTAVAHAVGSASVAEAAALAASGADELLVSKRCTPRVCTAVARVGV